MTDWLDYYDPSQWRDVAPSARAAAEQRQFMESLAAARGEDYLFEWGNQNFDSLFERLRDQPDGLADYELGMVASMVTRLYYSPGGKDADGNTVDSGKLRQDAQGIYDVFGGARLDDHLALFNREIAGELAAGMGGKRETKWYGKLWNATIEAADWLDLGWRYVSAPIVGNTVGMVSRGLQGEGWRFRGDGELDVDGDDRVAFLEAAFGYDPNAWWGHVVNIPTEIVLDPTSWLSFGMGGAAKGSLRAAGVQLNKQATPLKEVGRLGLEFSQRGLKGMAAKDRDTIVDALMRAHVSDRRLLDKKAGGLKSYYNNLSFSPLDKALAEVPDYLRGSVRASHAKLAGEVGDEGAAQLLAWGMRSLPKGLKALDRAGPTGLKLGGRLVPWWGKGGMRLSELPAVGARFSPEATRMLGGEASAVYRTAAKAARGVWGRAEMAGRFGHGMATSVRQYSRAARSDARMKVGYNREEGLAKHVFARRHYAANMQDVRRPDMQRAVRWYVPGLTAARVKNHLRKLPNDHKDKVRFRELEQINKYVSTSALPEEKPQGLVDMIEAKGADYVVDLVDKRDEYMAALVESKRFEMAKKAKPAGAKDEAYIPFEEAQSRRVTDSRDQAAHHDLADLVNDGDAMWIGDRYVVDNVHDMTLMSSRMNDDQLANMSKLAQYWEILGSLWSGSALSHVKGPVSLWNNMVGGFTNMVLSGVNPLVAGRNMGYVAGVMRLHDHAISGMKAAHSLWKRFTDGFPDLTGDLLARVDKESAVSLLNGKIAASSGRARDGLRELRDQIAATDEFSQATTSYLYQLRGVGLKKRGLSAAKSTAVPEDLAEQIALLEAVGYGGVIGSGKTLDIRMGGMEELEHVQHPVWKTADTDLEGIRGWFDKLKKGDTEARISLFTLGSHVPNQKFEDFIRVLTLKSGLDQGLTWDEAMELVAKSQFDYGDLRRVEANFKARWSRFYVYPKNLMGLITSQMLSNPGRVLATNRAIFDSFRYVHQVAFNDDGSGGTVDLLVPDFVERRPGVFVGGGVMGIIRLPVYEYLDVVQAAAGVVPAIFPVDDGELFPQAQALEAQESASRVLSLLSGLAPELFKHAMEVATGRDSFTGRDLSHDTGVEQWMRTVGVVLPGMAQAHRNVDGIVDRWGEEFADRRAMVRLISMIDGSWTRTVEELDDLAMSQWVNEIEESIEDARKNGIDVEVITDLEKAGTVDPQTTRYLLYGLPLDRDDPEFDPDRSRASQRRPMTQQEFVDSLPPGLAEALGLPHGVTSESPLLSFEGHRNALAKHISEDILDSFTRESWVLYLSRNAVSSRRHRELSGVGPPAAPSPPRLDDLSDEDILDMIRSDFAAGGSSLAEALRYYPYLGEFHRRYTQLTANGLTHEEAVLEVLQEVPDEFRFLTEPGWLPPPQVTGLPAGPEEIANFRRRRDDLAGLSEWLYGHSAGFAEYLAGVSLLSRGEQSAIFGSPLVPDLGIPSGLPGGAVSLIDAVNKLGS